MKRLLLISLTLTASTLYSYDVIDRFSLIEDKLKTDMMLRPIGHDFIFDISVMVNKDLTGFIDDAEKVTKVPSTDQLAAAQEFMVKYQDTEQHLHAHTTLGFPLPSFSAWGIKIRPNVRGSIDFGANLGVATETFDADLLVKMVGSDVPKSIVDAVRSQFGSYTANAPLINNAVCTAAGIPLGAACDAVKAEYDKYRYPSNTSLPNLNIYTKLEGKGGFKFDYEKGNRWFGYLSLWANHRTDFVAKVNSDTLVNDTDLLSYAKKLNSQLSLMTDYQFGHRFKRFSVLGQIEDIKIATLSDNKEKAGDLNYEIDPLLRLHGDATFKFDYIQVVPFLGAHKRSTYDFADGIYAGTDLSAFVWKERLATTLRVMGDNEFITISPRLKLWLMQLDYTLKNPITSKKDNLKLSTLHALNFRMFF